MTNEANLDGAGKRKERRGLLGYTVEELRDLVRTGLESGPSEHASMDEIKAEARRRGL